MSEKKPSTEEKFAALFKGGPINPIRDREIAALLADEKPCLGFSCDYYQVAGPDGEKRVCALDGCPPVWPSDLRVCRHPEAIP